MDGFFGTFVVPKRFPRGNVQLSLNRGCKRSDDLQGKKHALLLSQSTPIIVSEMIDQLRVSIYFLEPGLLIFWLDHLGSDAQSQSLELLD